MLMRGQEERFWIRRKLAAGLTLEIDLLMGLIFVFFYCDNK